MKQRLKNVGLIASILFLISFLFVSNLRASQQNPFNNEGVQVLNEGWVLQGEDGTTTPVVLPAHLSADVNTWVRIERDMPEDLPKPLVLCLRSSQQQVRILFEGEEIYTFGLEDNAIPFGYSPGSAWNLVRLPEAYAGGRVTIELRSPYPMYSGVLSEVRVGSKAALLFWLMQTYLPALALTLFIALVGIGLLLGYLFFFRRYGVGHSALYLGLFALVASFWLFGETRMVQFFTGNVFANMMLTLLSMLLFPVPLLLYVGEMEGFHYRKPLRSVALGIYLVALVACGMEMWGPWDFIIMLPVFQGLLLSTGIILLVLLLIEWLRWHNNQAKILFFSLLIICFFGAAEVFHLYRADGSNTGMFMRVGVLLFIAIQAALAARRAAQVVRLSREATIDGLTGCFNRTAYRQTLSQVGTAGRVTVMIDLNDLKFINDAYGHEAGDDALIRCAKCFREVYHSYGKCYRMGGDEFLFLGQGMDDPLLERLAKKFRRVLKEACKETPYALEAAIGWATFDPAKDTALPDTLRRADQAMYANKRTMK